MAANGFMLGVGVTENHQSEPGPNTFEEIMKVLKHHQFFEYLKGQSLNC